jgi:assimilatory nitrate reductase electron transfer subunit
MGIECGRAVVIDDQCRTSHPDVFAVGDCAEHRGIPYGLVGPAWEQADVVVDLLSGVNPDAAYEGSRLVTRLKASGIDLAAMGEVEGDEVVSFADPTRGTYARLVIDAEGRLAGAVMLGDNPMVGQVVQLFDTGDPVPHDRRTLLMGRPGESVSVAPDTPASMPDEVVVCRCNNVTKKELSSAFLNGARTPEALSEATQASTGCGTCAEDVAGLCKWLNSTVAGIGRAAEQLNEVSA